VCQLGVALDRTTTHVFRAEVDGRIAQRPGLSAATRNNFPYTNGTFFHEIFVPRGADRPYGKMDAAEFARYDYRRRCVAQAAPAILPPTSTPFADPFLQQQGDRLTA
jgi:inosine/xanthosine triphosphate pyrophosphatase family protein